MLKFAIRGSDDNQYEVIAVREGLHLRMSCTCAAGQNGTICRHRIALMDGDPSLLLSRNVEDIGHLKKLLSGTHVERRYEIICDLEKKKAALDDELKREKKALAREMGSPT
jgi:hypothetical protein